MVDITAIDKRSLVDIKSIRIDPSLPIEARMRAYLEQVRNPYCFLSGETPVKLRFAEQGINLDDTFRGHLLRIKSV